MWDNDDCYIRIYSNTDCFIKVLMTALLELSILSNIFAFNIFVCENLIDSNSNIHNIHFSPTLTAFTVT